MRLDKYSWQNGLSYQDTLRSSFFYIEGSYKGREFVTWHCATELDAEKSLVEFVSLWPGYEDWSIEEVQR